MVAGLAGGSGKSVVSVGLTALLAREYGKVVPFKKGPDYIDAGWMQLAAQNSCYNLDPFLMSEQTISHSFVTRAHGADFVVAEGNRGLYDGVNADGGYSSAELAKSLGLPVLLVVNCTKTTRTVAAMVLGCMKLDPEVNICGVVLNQIATKRQKAIITEAVEKYTGLPVLGTIPRLKRDIFPMRHLGMIPHQEYQGSDDALALLVETVRDNIDLTAIMEKMVVVPTREPEPLTFTSGEDPVKIGILRDAAFQFYYSENLEALERAGAEIVPINAMTEQALPEVDGLYIGGGFPETSARELAANERFRESVRQAAEDGLPIYAECGGLIYLGESIELEGQQYPLTGVFPIHFGMSKKPQAHGYSIFTVTGQNPFYPLGANIKGHEFRYSTINSYGGSDDELSVTMERGTGFLDKKDGLTKKNVFALYTHVHADGTTEWADGLVSRCRMRKKQG